MDQTRGLVLVVEDEPAISDLVRRYLTAAGFGVHLETTVGHQRRPTDPNLQVVAAVLLGGVSIFGGVGSVLGVMSGVLLLGTVRNTLQLLGVSSDVLQIVTGLILIASVVGPNLAAALRRRRPAPVSPAPVSSTPRPPTHNGDTP